MWILWVNKQQRYWENVHPQWILIVWLTKIRNKNINNKRFIWHWETTRRPRCYFKFSYLVKILITKLQDIRHKYVLKKCLLCDVWRRFVAIIIICRNMWNQVWSDINAAKHSPWSIHYNFFPLQFQLVMHLTPPPCV